MNKKISTKKSKSRNSEDSIDNYKKNNNSEEIIDSSDYDTEENIINSDCNNCSSGNSSYLEYDSDENSLLEDESEYEESENEESEEEESEEEESEEEESEEDNSEEEESQNDELEDLAEQQEEEEYNENYKLNDNWILWYHHEKNNWKINGYRKIYKIETIKHFWELYNNFDRIGGINNQHFFLMREGIEPIWEDEMNKKGGCWSYKKMENESFELWEDLSVRIIGENLLDDNTDLNGLSICLKRQSNSVIKIWNKNSKNNNISLINKDILNKYGKDILYIAHIPEF